MALRWCACPAGAAAWLALAAPWSPLAEALTISGPPPPPGAAASPSAGGRRAEARVRLPDHLESIRRKPFGERSSARTAVTLADARVHLRQGLQAAWHIGNHFGHQWSTAATDPASTGQRRAAGAGDVACGIPGGRLVRPADYGADPSGQADSTEAMSKAMAALLNTSASPKVMMANGITNLGGATLDLDGGVYLISQPVVFPAFVGNAGIAGGTLRASEQFPNDRWLVEIGDFNCEAKLPSGKPDQQGCCNQFIKIEDILFDSSHTSSGGVRVMHTMGASIGPSVFFTGFNLVGARVDAGHEVMIQQAWFAEYYWSEVTPQIQSSSRSIGVMLNGPDHILTDVIVFNFAHIGVEVNSPANLLQNVHTWNGGGTGIVLNPKAKTCRLLGCYLDRSELIIHDPQHTVVESTFFLEAHATLKSIDNKWIKGLRFRSNTYARGAADVPASVVLDGFNGGYVDIQDELTDGTQLKLTRARRSMWQKDATKWLFDFSDELLLPDIEEVVYSFVSDSDSDFVRHLARKPSGRTVLIETDAPASGTVTVEVFQGKPWKPKGLQGFQQQARTLADGEPPDAAGEAAWAGTLRGDLG